MAALKRAPLVALALVVTGCGGGGTHGAIPPAKAVAASTHVTLSLLIPRAPAGRARMPQYISAGTKSIVVKVDGGAPQGFNVGAGSPYCTSGASGTTCNLSLIAPLNNGFDTFVIDAYDQPLTTSGAGQGNVLSDATVPVLVIEGQNNPIQLSLGGAVATVSLNVPDPPLFWTEQFLAGGVVAKDAAGYTIVGTYDAPIAIAVTPSTSLTWEGGLSILTSGDGFGYLTFEGTPSGPVTLKVTAANGATASKLLTPIVQSGTEATTSTSVNSIFVDVPYNRTLSYNTLGETLVVVGLQQPRAAAFDPNGNLIVADAGSSTVDLYPAGSDPGTPASITLPSSAFGSAAPQAVANDPSGGTLYVATSTAISKFSLPLAAGATPRASIAGAATGLQGITGLAAGATEIAVSLSNGSVMTFPKGAVGNVAPQRVIAGGATTLQTPQGLAYDATGNLYVADAAANDVAVFGAGTTGNVAPAAALAGTATALQMPVGVAFDHTGALYVVDHSRLVHIYAAGASGNVAPQASATGSTTASGLAVMP